MAAAVADGYATSGTDTGHVERTGLPRRFALGHPEKVKDFGWRAVHDMTVKTKVLVKAFYGKAVEQAYFSRARMAGERR